MVKTQCRRPTFFLLPQSLLNSLLSLIFRKMNRAPKDDDAPKDVSKMSGTELKRRIRNITRLLEKVRSHPSPVLLSSLHSSNPSLSMTISLDSTLRSSLRRKDSCLSYNLSFRRVHLLPSSLRRTTAKSSPKTTKSASRALRSLTTVCLRGRREEGGQGNGLD